ncbi:Heme-thiolate peroxidase [Mycena chlorophos]|uniref:Heme-thiolate peroxidase n=1 Tax=Mycena chlorophos TaxID=658473 RepID=A0A8H6VXR5_MYCCL|nr:Heme-thiolate peroxidase [Mycena chlorophos]
MREDAYRSRGTRNTAFSALLQLASDTRILTANKSLVFCYITSPAVAALYEHAVAMRPFAILALFLDLFDLAAQPHAPQRPHAQEVLDGYSGTLIAMPPLPTYTGAKIIPDTDHPYIAPGPEDLRGPCPGMNTLANHGYIPRSGIASFEDIVSGMTEAFNLDQDFGAFITALNMLMRGNPFVNKMSIGGVSPLVPPLPNNAGTPGGISLHGGIEGDASMTRADMYIGDNINFQHLMYDMDLVLLGQHGGNGPDGNSTVFTRETMVAIKTFDILSDQANNPKFDYPPRRINGSFLEASFVIEIFANHTTNQATLPIVGSFMRNETFPQNWFRPAAPKTGGESALAILEGLQIKVVPGHNDENGVYVADAPLPAPFNNSLACAAYYDFVAAIPPSLGNSTGLLFENVKFLSNFVSRSMRRPECDVALLPGPIVVDS